MILWGVQVQYNWIGLLVWGEGLTYSYTSNIVGPVWPPGLQCARFICVFGMGTGYGPVCVSHVGVLSKRMNESS